MPHDDVLRDVLTPPKTIAIIGAKDIPGQDVDEVGRYLIASGYTIIPINPARSRIWGIRAYSNLEYVPYPVDIVDVFCAPEYCQVHAGKAVRLSPLPKTFWMQLGIMSAEAKDIAERAGITVIENACIKIEHRRLFA